MFWQMEVASSSGTVSLWFSHESYNTHLQYSYYGNTLNGKVKGLFNSQFSAQVSNFQSCSDTFENMAKDSRKRKVGK